MILQTQARNYNGPITLCDLEKKKKRNSDRGDPRHA